MAKIISIDLSKKVRELYRDYGMYVNQFRAFPSIYDGLKLVERRLLYSLFEIAREFRKSATVVGHCVGHYHPHGDISVYDSLVSMVHNGLVIGQGNFGNYHGVHVTEPAAMRYTEVKLPDNIGGIFKNLIRYVPFEQFELSNEPVFLPTLLPFCLIGNEFTYGVGVGYRTLIPCYNPEDLVKRLFYLLGINSRKCNIKPNVSCDLLDGDYESILTTGKGSIAVRVKYNIISSTEVDILSTIPLKSFGYVLNTFRKEIEEEKILGWQDLSTTKPCLRLIILDDSLTMETLENKIKTELQGKINFECYLTDAEGNVKLISVDDLLLFVYNNFKKLVKSKIEHQINELDEKISEIKILQIIRENISLYFSQEYNFEKIIKNIGEDPSKVKHILQKYNIMNLFNIQEDLLNTKTSKQELKQQLEQLDQYVYGLYQQYYCQK